MARLLFDLVPDANRIIRNAVRELGSDLCGSSPIDLLIDNIPDLRDTRHAWGLLQMSAAAHDLSPRIRSRYLVRSIGQ